MKKYPHVLVGGTFDRLHRGHEAILRKAFAVGEQVTIGLTSDRFITKYKSQIPNPNDQISNQFQNSHLASKGLTFSDYELQSYRERKSELERWLKQNRYINRATVHPIDDPYEPGSSRTDIDALVVSTETKKRGMEINEIRKSRGLAQLVLIEVPLVDAHDGNPISSSRIRNREIDSNGRLIMPESLRTILSQPLGKILSEKDFNTILSHQKRPLITVGDVTTERFLKSGVTPDIMIIDHRVGRKEYAPLRSLFNTLILHSIRVKSGPGFISAEATVAVKNAVQRGRGEERKRGVVIEVDGEEDLLALCAIRYAPHGAHVYYGQPGEGMVEVVITEAVRQKVIELLRLFT
ncbi:DUF359 domain-containing protein [Patescibacteria group bacterium]|nr:DUF359 domain-containing protein [Patescibacteria group bacterium]